MSSANRRGTKRAVVLIGVVIVAGLVGGALLGAALRTQLERAGLIAALRTQLEQAGLRTAREPSASDAADAQGTSDTTGAARLHPQFDLSAAQLSELVSILDPALAAPLLEAPHEFLDHAAALLDVDQEFLILVDKRNPLPADYRPTDLVDLNRHRDRLVLNRNDLSLRDAILPALFEMVEAARRDGITLDLSSTFRSYEYQAALFERNVAALGLEAAERESARAGTSQHQLGTTIDFGSITPAFGSTPAGRWLARNARQFGFSLSYPDGYEWLTGYIFESWHYRYITPAGTAMEERFFGGIQQYLLEFWVQAAPQLRLRRTRTSAYS